MQYILLQNVNVDVHTGFSYDVKCATVDNVFVILGKFSRNTVFISKKAVRNELRITHCYLVTVNQVGSFDEPSTRKRCVWVPGSHSFNSLSVTFLPHS